MGTLAAVNLAFAITQGVLDGADILMQLEAGAAMIRELKRQGRDPTKTELDLLRDKNNRSEAEVLALLANGP